MNLKKSLALLLSLVLALSIAACAAPEASAPVDETPIAETTTPAPAPAEAAAAYTPGAYTASARGMWGMVPVTVTVSDSAIESVEVGDNIETAGLRDWPTDIIPAAIVGGQTLAVDTVTGATMTSRAILAAAEDCLAQAGADIAALKTAPEKTPAADAALTADIVIIGGGGAGLAAACSATELGASVIVIEKMGTLGGNSMVCGGIYNAPDPDEQGPLGIEDSPEFYAQQTWEGGDMIANKDLVDVMCHNALDGLNWMKSMGLEFKPGVGQGTGALYQRTHYAVLPNGTGYIKAFTETLKSRGDLCRIMTDTTGTGLIVENGRVVGVNAAGKDGNAVTLTASKGVIVATGGFAGNAEMRVEYCQGEKWPDLGPSLITSNMPGVTGDGIRMCRDAGANLVDIEQIQLLPVCNPTTGSTSDHYNASGVQAYVLINKEGVRFVAEDGRRDVISKTLLAQTDGVAYLLMSADSITDPAAQTVAGGRSIADMVETGDSGWLSADTLEEMAVKMGVPADALIGTIDDFNAHVETGEADAFGRLLFNYKFEAGPWYAYPRAPAAHYTMGGVEIDIQARVLGTDGKIIPGLYAAGEVTGGIHGGNRLGGNGIVDFVVFGRIAGTTAASE